MAIQDPRIKEAERMRKNRNFIMKHIFSNDYIGSGDLFVDVANSTKDIAERKKYFNEAAKTYAMTKTRFGYFKCAEVYKLLIKLETEKKNTVNVGEYLELYAEAMTRVSDQLLAAVAFTKAGKVYEEISREKAIVNYEKAKELFLEKEEYKAHLKSVNEKLLNIYINAGKYEECLKILKELNLAYKSLCVEMLTILLGRVSEEEGLKNSKEREIVRCIINKSGEEGISMLESFMKDNFLPDYMKNIILAVIDKISPDNSIC